METEAYAKLQGPSFTAYLTDLSMTLGRKEVSPGHICLGEDKKISKEHARITWNGDSHFFYIKCIGRNSMIVNQIKVTAEDDPVKLESKTPVRIGSVEFYFLLPV